MHVLVTGGTGFIGSHAVVELINAGHTAVVVDNLSNSSPAVLDRIKELTGQPVPFFEVDLRDREGLQRVFSDQPFDCCFHFAGLKAVGESVRKPWMYYDNNLTGTLVLLDVMQQNGLKNIVYSSTATVYGDPETVPITEQHPKGICTNPYAHTKSVIEDILIAMRKADLLNNDDHPWKVVILRYANPIGAHPSGKIGEDPRGIPNNLMPYITQVAVGKREKLTVFGDDYDTPDGTGVRDYIHVVDLAKGHVDALSLFSRPDVGVEIFNLSTGRGNSVLDVVHAFERVNHIKIPYEIGPRRDGDIATSYLSPARAEKKLGWKAVRTIDDMCRDSWNWQRNNPNGYV